MSEFPVIYWDQHQYGRIDCAWFPRGKHIPHVVFEIEGINVKKPSLRVDLRKFRWSKAKHKVVFLYSDRKGAPLVADNGHAVRQVQQRIAEIQENADWAQRVEVIAVTRDEAMAYILRTGVERWGDDV